MKEYRIVATIDYRHGGKTAHYDVATPWVQGVPFGPRRYETKAKAAQVLKELKKECAEEDRLCNERFERDPKNYIHRVQSNLRIQSREITPWVDVAK